MSCGNIKLVGYNNLNNIIIKEHGSNNSDYYSLIAMDEDPIFKKIIADKVLMLKLLEDKLIMLFLKLELLNFVIRMI